jgi:uncharacterized protein (TIGR01777 family)
MNTPPGKIVILGGTGFVGTALRKALPDSLLLRSRSRGPGSYDVASGWMDAETLRGADVVINLAGSPIAVRWTASARAQIRESRAGTTSLLVKTLRDAGITPRVVVSMSGANRYAADADALIDESSPLNDNSFLGGICRDWESPLEALPQGTRVTILRTGVVIGPGGAMAKLAPLFRLGLGGPLGHGQQWMPWIHRGDLIRLILFCLAENGPRGVLNATNPLPVTNREFTQAVARGVRRPAFLPAPAWALRLAYGQMAQEALLDSRRVVPAAALAHGFRFDQPGSGLADSIREALAAL